ncbi:hypothetical protein WJX84_007515 [Apatococcus fuscideae]|uniref:PsbP C-terminal domain-containing protein n=1 Tax=Apatococcus fuscideae TaxID=2026836 RepID=A0AAW1RRM5_9CHLO
MELPNLQVSHRSGLQIPWCVHKSRVRCSADKHEQKRAPAEQAGDRKGPQLRLSDPVETISWGGRQPSGRRALLSALTGTSIVLISNLGGTTSALLGLAGGETARSAHLDVLYPIQGYKRCLDSQNGYEFVYPSKWLADQRLFRRYAARVEQRSGLDLPSPARRPQRRPVAEPTAAFGPAGSTGEENVSVVVAPIMPGFSLQSLGSAEEAAARFLSTVIAPPGSKLQTTLIISTSRQDEGGTLYYTLEYTVKGPSFFRHNLSVYASRGGQLYTLNAQAAEERWQDTQLVKQFRRAASSFHIL